MTNADVISLVAEALSIDPATLNASSSSKTVEAWDSMGTMNILLDLDTKCGVQLALGETKQLQSIAEIEELLRKVGKL